MNQRRLIEFNGVIASRKEWAEVLGITLSALSIRIKKWGVLRALSTPKNPGNPGQGLKDLTGATYGRLTVVAYVGRYKSDRHHVYLCQCSCGNTIQAHSGSLKKGRIRSCGCLRKEVIKDVTWGDLWQVGDRVMTVSQWTQEYKLGIRQTRRRLERDGVKVGRANKPIPVR